MSGICAVWQKQDPGGASQILTRVCAGLRLDPSEILKTAVDSDVAVGVAARFGGQQIYESPDLLVACDAEIYDDGSMTAGMTHAAVFAALYQRFCAAFMDEVRGEFSVILWDKRRRLLFAATDGFGVHPLVYYEKGGNIMIASRIDALTASGRIALEVNPHAIANYLNYTVNLAPDTIVSKVTRLRPGTYLQASTNDLRTARYWDMCYETDPRASEDKLGRGLEMVVEEAVATHSRHEDFARLGAFLSGGTDSSTVVGMMARLKRGPVQTFSIGFEEKRFNELQYAKIAASCFQTNHHEYRVTAPDCLESLPRMVRCFDEPFGNSSAIPTYFCARLAAQHGVDILLAGDGGDELFGGNERYRTDKIFEVYQNIPRPLRKGVIEPVLAGLPMSNGVVGKARRYVRRSNFPQPYRFFSYNPLLENSPADIFDKDFLASLGGYSVLEIPSQYYWHGPAQDHLNRLLYLDVKVTLGDNDLLKVTRMSELAGVRPRFPYLDRSVAELSGAIPSRLKVKGFQKRYLFKRAFRDLLPVEILQKTKRGFGIPVAYWMKSDPRMRELTNDILRSSRSRERGFFRQDYMEELFRKHEQDETPFYGDELWVFLTLELWCREFMDQPVRAAAC